MINYIDIVSNLLLRNWDRSKEMNRSKQTNFMKILLGILVLLFYNCIFAPRVDADIHNDVVEITDYKETALDGSWKIMRGDELEYKNPYFDDSGWNIIEVPSNSQQFSISGNDVIWYRKSLYLPLAKPTFTLGMELGKIAYSDEVYVNGQLIGASNSGDTDNIFIEKVRIYQVPSEILKFGGYNTVAIRVQGGTSNNIGIITGKLVLGNYAQLGIELVRTEAAVLIFSGSFIILGLCLLFFFIQRPQEREYLFLGLGSLDMGGYTFYVSQWRYILGIENLCDSRFYYLTTFFVVPIFLRFTYELLPRSNPYKKVERLFDFFTKGLFLYAGILVVSLLLYNDIHAWEYVDAYVNNVVIIVASCIGISYLLYKLTVKDKDVLMMFCGCTIAIISGILETIRQYYPVIPQYIATWGLAIFIFSQVIVLANRFLRLHKKNELYSQTLEKMVDTRTKQLHVMEESRRRLLANISHDLRTPVTSVPGHVEILLEGIAESPEQQRTYLKRIHSKMIGLNRLIHDLFDLVKLEACQTSFQMKEFSAEEFITDIYLNYISDVENAGFHLEYKSDISPKLLIKADSDRLDQVFANLISNSIQYMGDGGNITLSCELMNQVQGETNRWVLFKVADNGRGIAPEHIPYVFERFYRGSQERESVSQNSGLGLVIAKEIVEAHGGRIWVDTQGGSGCTMCFTIPVSC